MKNYQNCNPLDEKQHEPIRDKTLFSNKKFQFQVLLIKLNISKLK